MDKEKKQNLKRILPSCVVYVSGSIAILLLIVYVMPLSFALNQENLTLISTMIWLGYIGVILMLVKTVRRAFLLSQKDPHYVSARQKRDLTKRKQFLRLVAPTMIMLYILACVGIWLITGQISVYYVHLLFIMALFLVLGYTDISLEERNSRAPPFIDETQKYEKSRYRGILKKIWYANTVPLFLFCIVYTHVKPFPFHGIWGVIAWGLTMATVYSAVWVLYIDAFREISILNEKRFYPLSTIISWIMAFVWLKFGETLI
ncbi:MAG: hypothetical protein HXS44_08040 [Theionarchaea archaeon]|nr:hypothetical protein [Theionarchaea archaeon]